MKKENLVGLHINPEDLTKFILDVYLNQNLKMTIILFTHDLLANKESHHEAKMASRRICCHQNFYFLSVFFLPVTDYFCSKMKKIH